MHSAEGLCDLYCGSIKVLEVMPPRREAASLNMIRSTGSKLVFWSPAAMLLKKAFELVNLQSLVCGRRRTWTSFFSCLRPALSCLNQALELKLSTSYLKLANLKVILQELNGTVLAVAVLDSCYPSALDTEVANRLASGHANQVLLPAQTRHAVHHSRYAICKQGSIRTAHKLPRPETAPLYQVKAFAVQASHLFDLRF